MGEYNVELHLSPASSFQTIPYNPLGEEGKRLISEIRAQKGISTVH